MLSPISHKISEALFCTKRRFAGVYTQAMTKIFGRLNDKRLERHISFLTECELAALHAGDQPQARAFELARLAAIRCRSNSQVERMERARGLR